MHQPMEVEVNTDIIMKMAIITQAEVTTVTEETLKAIMEEMNKK